MINLASSSDVIQIITASAASIECHASYVDLVLSSGAVTPGRRNIIVSTAATTTLVGSPAAGSVRNIKHINISNDSATPCDVTVVHSDGTTAVELMRFVLKAGENMILNAEGRWTHSDSQGAEYPPAGLGAYNGRSIPFMKTGTGSDAVGYWYCTAKDPGFPGAWSPGTPGLNGRVTDGTAVADYGALQIPNAANGANFLTELQIATSVNHSNVFFDCLWVNSGLVVTTTTAQAIVTPTLPARDDNGTSNGEGCMIGLYFSAASTLAAAGSNLTVSYTNSKGVAGRTASLVAVVGSMVPATPVIGTIVWFNLDAGDSGVRSIQSITLGTSMLTGTIHLLIARRVATVGTTVPNLAAQKIISSPGIRLYNGACILHCVLSSSVTATFFNGELLVMEK